MAGGNSEGDFTRLANDSENFSSRLMETIPESAKMKNNKKNNSRLSQCWSIVLGIPGSWKF
jgi:hypothetical protein